LIDSQVGALNLIGKTLQLQLPLPTVAGKAFRPAFVISPLTKIFFKRAIRATTLIFTDLVAMRIVTLFVFCINI